MSEQFDFSEDTSADYVDLDLLLDADQLTLYSIDYMEEAIPGWTARPASPETIMMEANGQMASEVVDQASAVPDEAMTYLGTSVYGFPMSDGAPSRGAATVVFSTDAVAVTIPQGTEVAVPHPSGTTFLFETDRDVVAPQGGGSVALSVIASEYGASQNGCFGQAEFQEEFEGVQSVTVDTTTAGADPEDPTDYLSRFSTYLSILTARPILPVDFARRAQLNPRVGRAVALDLYQPATADGGVGLPRGATAVTNVERCCTVVVTGEDGALAPMDLMQEVYADLDANREVNFLVYVIPAGSQGVYTSIDVQAAVRPYPGITDADAIAQAEAMVEQLLSPVQRGVVPGTGGPATWAVDNKVRIYEIVDWLNRAPAVFYVVSGSVQIKKSSDPTWSTTDLTLSGAVPMTTPGSVVITIGT